MEENESDNVVLSVADVNDDDDIDPLEEELRNQINRKKGGADNVKKRPAARTGDGDEAATATKVAKRPAARANGVGETPTVTEVAKRSAHLAVVVRPKAPVGSATKPPDTVRYKGAFMYTSWAQKAYRVIKDIKISRSDRRLPFFSHSHRIICFVRIRIIPTIIRLALSCSSALR